MDKSIFTALNSMQILKNNQSVTSQNLSNTNVPGFKKDIHANFGSLYLDREKGIDPRVYALSDVGAFDNSQGALNPTERPLDLSIDGDGYFIVNPKNGNQALSRRGDLKVDENRILIDNTGAQILSVDLEPIEILPILALFIEDKKNDDNVFNKDNLPYKSVEVIENIKIMKRELESLLDKYNLYYNTELNLEFPEIAYLL